MSRRRICHDSTVGLHEGEELAARQLLAKNEVALTCHPVMLNDLLGQIHVDVGYFAELSEVEKPKTKRAPSKVTYRHPENPSLTWSGRGRKPEWFKAHVDAGKDPSDLIA